MFGGRSALTAAGLAWLIGMAGPATAAAPAEVRAGSPQAPTAQACEGVARVNLFGLTVIGAETDHGACRLRARTGRTGLEIRLPLSGWNGRLYLLGCSGMCGGLDGHDQTSGMAQGLARGYAVATLDGGHVSASVMDAGFARGAPQAREDFAEGSVHAAAVSAKAVAAAYYGRPAASTWFNGCSTGGRQGLIAAERYPKDFDGIIAGSPAFDSAGLTTYWTWIAQADLRPDGSWTLPLSAARLLDAAVARRCGDKDGVVQDPRRCRFEAGELACRPGGPKGCLTPDELRVVRRWYSGPRDSAGRQLYPDGVPLGSESFWDRPGMPPRLGAVMGFQKAAAELGIRDLLIDPPLTGEVLSTFDLERDRHRFDAADALMTPKPNLAAYAARGGKLLIYQGWADPITPPLRTLGYVRDVRRALGSRRGDAHLRLFLIPGLNHCGGLGARATGGVDQRGLDPLTALEDWDRTGQAPAQLMTRKVDAAGATLWSRPICAWPALAVSRRRTVGGEPETWRCVAPRGRTL